MRYAQFYAMSTGYVAGTIPPRFEASSRAPIEACGSDGVLILDARRRVAGSIREALQHAKARGFVGVRIYEGERFSSARPLTPFYSTEPRT